MHGRLKQSCRLKPLQQDTKLDVLAESAARIGTERGMRRRLLKAFG